jgi:hypothetical protein
MHCISLSSRIRHFALLGAQLRNSDDLRGFGSCANCKLKVRRVALESVRETHILSHTPQMVLVHVWCTKKERDQQVVKLQVVTLCESIQW